jgi:lysozyme
VSRPARGARPATPGLAAASVAAALAVATPLIMAWEGDGGQIGYLDVVRVPTACWGHTGRGVVVGRRYSGGECRAFLDGDVRRHADGIARCIAVDTPPQSLAALVSFSFNIGVDGFCRSRVRRDLNAGDLARACADLSAYVYAGRPPRRVRGLVNRRAAERRLCERGIRR